MGAHTERQELEDLVDEAVVRMVIWTSQPMPEAIADQTEAALSAKAVAVAPKVGVETIRSILDAARDRVHNRQRGRWESVLDSVIAALNEPRRASPRP